MTETVSDMKKRLLRESRAMLIYVSGRGLQKELPRDATLALFDLPEDQRLAAPMKDIMALHQSLSRMVAPALPETIERLHYHQERIDDGPSQFWRRLAPLSSVFWLMLVTVAIVVCLGWLLTADHQDSKAQNGLPKLLRMSEVKDYLQGPCRSSVLFQIAVTDEAAKMPGTEADEIKLRNARNLVQKQCRDKRKNALFGLFFLFGLLGALGAAYASIYDSFAYIREGRYDLRLASTYYVRIFLGAFSGILLAEPLADYLDQGAFSSSLLAFLGGFAAQLVYDLLNKLVDSVANMFRPLRRKERQAIHEQAELNAREAILQDAAAKRAELARIIETTEAIADPARRADAMRKAVIRVMAGDGEPLDAVSGRVAPETALAQEIAGLAAMIDLGHRLLPQLPDDEDTGRMARLEAAMAELKTAAAGLKAGTVEARAEAEAAAVQAREQDIVGALIAKSRAGLAALFDPSLARALARAAVVAADGLDATQRLRWHAAAYGATPDTPLLLVTDAGPEALTAGTGAMAEALAAADTATLRGLVAAGDTEALFRALSSAFADRASFDAALADWQADLCERLLARDIETAILPRIGETVGSAALAGALHRVAADEAATAALQQLELIGGSVAGTAAPELTMAELLDRIGAANGGAG